MQENDVCQQECIHIGTVKQAMQQMLSQDKAVRLAETFKVLADPTRVKILHVLTKQEMCVCDIAAALSMGQSAISHQLRVLRNARLVRYRKDGKIVWYSLDDDHVVSLFQQGLEHIDHI